MYQYLSSATATTTAVATTTAAADDGIIPSCPSLLNVWIVVMDLFSGFNTRPYERVLPLIDILSAAITASAWRASHQRPFEETGHGVFRYR